MLKSSTPNVKVYIEVLRHNSSRSKLYDELGWDLLSTRRMILHHNIYVTYLNLFTQEVTDTTEEITTNLFYLKSKQHYTWKLFAIYN